MLCKNILNVSYTLIDKFKQSLCTGLFDHTSVYYHIFYRNISVYVIGFPVLLYELFSKTIGVIMFSRI